MEGVGYDFIGKSTTIENVGENMKRSTIQVAVILYGLLTLLGLVFFLSFLVMTRCTCQILFITQCALKYCSNCILYLTF